MIRRGWAYHGFLGWIVPGWVGNSKQRAEIWSLKHGGGNFPSAIRLMLLERGRAALAPRTCSCGQSCLAARQIAEKWRRAVSALKHQFAVSKHQADMIAQLDASQWLALLLTASTTPESRAQLTWALRRTYVEVGEHRHGNSAASSVPAPTDGHSRWI